jgi:hypothetical protein
MTTIRPSTPPPMPDLMSAPQLAAANLPAREPILDPILAQKSLMMLYGPRGLGKTHVALGLAWAAASGQSFLKWKAERPHKVVYVDGEMAAVDLQQRLCRLGSMPETLRFLIADLNPERGLADLCSFAGQAALIGAWGDKPDLVVLDNLSSLVGFSRNNPDSWSQVQRWLMAMRRLGIAMLVLHHANKDGEQRGTSQREDLLDIIVSMQRPSDYTPQQGARFELHFEKARGLHGEDVEPIEAWLETDNIGVQRWKWQALEQSEFDRVVALLRQGMNPAQVAREFGCHHSRAYRIRNKAMALGLLPRERPT